MSFAHRTPAELSAWALVEAGTALRQALRAVEAALDAVQSGAPASEPDGSPIPRSTSLLVLQALRSSRDPLTLSQIADEIVAYRRGEDAPRPHGGTRYEEMARNAILRLIRRGLVERVEATNKHEKMRFKATYREELAA